MVGLANWQSQQGMQAGEVPWLMQGATEAVNKGINSLSGGIQDLMGNLQTDRDNSAMANLLRGAHSYDDIQNKIAADPTPFTSMSAQGQANALGYAKGMDTHALTGAQIGAQNASTGAENARARLLGVQTDEEPQKMALERMRAIAATNASNMSSKSLALEIAMRNQALSDQNASRDLNSQVALAAANPGYTSTQPLSLASGGGNSNQDINLGSVSNIPGSASNQNNPGYLTSGNLPQHQLPQNSAAYGVSSPKTVASAQADTLLRFLHDNPKKAYLLSPEQQKLVADANGSFQQNSLFTENNAADASKAFTPDAYNTQDEKTALQSAAGVSADVGSAIEPMLAAYRSVADAGNSTLPYEDFTKKYGVTPETYNWAKSQNMGNEAMARSVAAAAAPFIKSGMSVPQAMDMAKQRLQEWGISGDANTPGLNISNNTNISNLSKKYAEYRAAEYELAQQRQRLALIHNYHSRFGHRDFVPTAETAGANDWLQNGGLRNSLVDLAQRATDIQKLIQASPTYNKNGTDHVSLGRQMDQQFSNDYNNGTLMPITGGLAPVNQ